MTFLQLRSYSIFTRRCTYLRGTCIHVPCGSGSAEASPAAQSAAHSYARHGSPARQARLARHTLPLGHGDDRHRLDGGRRGDS